ncbi:hypothetical protein [Psychroserpens luteus]|uniref:Uncharacterized protein n=1 Tax=Psychroserpens luteus TaxID=1434066 RepID=A0ABW5ZZ99_9FLAO|nr:hypothetical protein [Psychroserpens luteus]
MVDIDLHNIQILTSQDIDLVQVSHVKEVEMQNNYLKYGLAIGGVLIIGLLIYSLSNYPEKQKRMKFWNHKIT